MRVPRSAISLIETGQRRVEHSSHDVWQRSISAPLASSPAKNPEPAALPGGRAAPCAHRGQNSPHRDQEELQRFAEFLQTEGVREPTPAIPSKAQWLQHGCMISFDVRHAVERAWGLHRCFCAPQAQGGLIFDLMGCLILHCGADWPGVDLDATAPKTAPRGAHELKARLSRAHGKSGWGGNFTRARLVDERAGDRQANSFARALRWKWLPDCRRQQR